MVQRGGIFVRVRSILVHEIPTERDLSNGEILDNNLGLSNSENRGVENRYDRSRCSQQHY